MTQVSRPAPLTALAVAPNHLEREEVRPLARPVPDFLQALLTLVRAQVLELPGQEKDARLDWVLHRAERLGSAFTHVQLPLGLRHTLLAPLQRAAAPL